MAKSRGRRKPKKQDETLLDIVEAREQAQDFFEKNQLIVIAAGALIVILIGAFLAYQMLYQGPRENEAMGQLYKAELQFQQDSFAMALENPGGGYDGFLDIIDSYGGTKAGNLAKYYAGISYLNLGRFEDAITYLQQYKADGKVTSITKHGALGDAYSELGNMEKALQSYEKAIDSESYFLTPYYLNKYGLLSQKLGNNDQALKAFKRIEKEFPKSIEASDISKYIAMLE